MPTLIRIKETGLKIEKKQGITKLSINTLYLEKGFQVADVIAMFNTSLADTEQRVSASIDAEAQLRINADTAFSSYLVNLETSVNDNFASVTTQISTLTTDISTVASSVTQLEVTLNGTINVRLEEMAKVFAGEFDYTATPSTPSFGDLKLVSGVTYQYLGGVLGPLNDGWVVYNETALGVANQVKGWVATASSLVVDPLTGNVTGWQYGDGSGFNSYFKISAENIELSGSTTFSDFAMKDMSNVTSIDGGKITTNTIEASSIKTYNLTSTNAAFENAIIKTAYIQDLGVSTLKIQDEAVIVPRSASGGYSCSIYYTPVVSHAVTIIGEWVQGSGRHGVRTKISINGDIVREETPVAGTLCSMFYNTNFYAGTTYTITLYTVSNVGDMSCRLLMLGTKK